MRTGSMGPSGFKETTFKKPIIYLKITQRRISLNERCEKEYGVLWTEFMFPSFPHKFNEMLTMYSSLLYILQQETLDWTAQSTRANKNLQIKPQNHNNYV